MSDFESTMTKLNEMRSRFDSGFSSSDRDYIERLYAQLLGKKVRRSGCGDCYRDAYIEIYSFLKRKGQMPTKPNYILKSGIVIQKPGTTTFYSNTNVPDAVAEEYLAKFPNNIDSFASYPADYLARVEARKQGLAVEEVDVDTLKESNKALKEENEKLKQKVAEYKARIELLGDTTTIESVAKELSAAKAELEQSNKTIAELKEKLAKAENADTIETTKTTETKRTRKVSAAH